MDGVLHALLLAATLALCGFYLFGGQRQIGRIAGRFAGGDRPGEIAAVGVATLLMFAAPALAGLGLLGEWRGLFEMPAALRPLAWALGSSGLPDPALLRATLGPLALGGALGVGFLAWRRWRGKRAMGLIYRSPLAARHRREMSAATLVAVAAGVGEELFFRLWLPLIVALATGSAAAGAAVGLAVFVALHRHQGWVGLIAVALVGAGLSWLYFATGILWAAMAVHVAIDLNALLLRPWLTTGLRRD